MQMQYETTNLALACCLILRGHELRGVRSSGRQAVFVFTNTPTLRADTLMFFNRQMRVEPLSFLETLRHLKGEARTGLLQNGDMKDESEIPAEESRAAR